MLINIMSDLFSVSNIPKVPESLKIVFKVALGVGLSVLAYDNRVMIANFSPKEVSQVNQSQLAALNSHSKSERNLGSEASNDNSARVSIFDNIEEVLEPTNSNCGVRSVFSGLSMITSEVGSKPFLDYQNQKVGSLGMSSGMMANFLDSLRGLGVNYKVHNTNPLNQAEFQTFLVKGIKEGKVPIVLIRQGLAFHWVAVRAIGEANTQGQVEVEVYEDLPNQKRSINRFSFNEFYGQTKLPLRQDSTFMLGKNNRADNVNRFVGSK